MRVVWYSADPETGIFPTVKPVVALAPAFRGGAEMLVVTGDRLLPAAGHHRILLAGEEVPPEAPDEYDDDDEGDDDA
jgi:hypothetical protein